MRVLIVGTLPEGSLESLRQADHVVICRNVRGSALQAAMQQLDVQVLVVRSTRVTAAMMASAPSLELMVRAGAGTDNIDVKEASRLGILVANCPGRNASAVAELTIGLMVALDRRIPDNVQAARQGRWEKRRFAEADGLRGRTLGVVGMGRIGREVTVMAQAMGMRVIAWSRSLTDRRAESLGVRRMSSLQKLAAAADIVTLHVAATAATQHLADAAFFEAMKPGAFFINTSRGSTVDESALRQAIREHGIRAGLDVFDQEPAYKEGPLDLPLSTHNEVYLTHHIGASTRQAQESTAAEAVRIINEYAQTGTAPNCINLAARSSATHLLTVRHLDRVGVLASVLQVVREHNLNVQEMENRVFAGEVAAVALIRLTGSTDPLLLGQINRLEHVLAAHLIDL
ncbi:MAG: phosphoglycerate dehydrogenase [Bacteroidota bacterium]|nr:phosphoglycerate dehydrogenase [Bacteroidota bacterium]